MITDQPKEVIFAVPYTSNIDQLGNVTASALSSMSAAATNTLMGDHPAAIVVIAGEHTFGAEHPSTGQLMTQEIGDATNRVVLLEDEFPGVNLNNTAFQVEAFNRWLQQFSRVPNLVSLGHDFHLQRLEIHMARYGIFSGFASIAKNLRREDDHASRYPELEHLHFFDKRESIVRAVAQVDRKGIITKRYTERFGPHVHDILIGSDGGAIFVDQSAQKRLSELGLSRT